MPVDRNLIWSRGEGIAGNLLTRAHGGAGPLFRPTFLGEKYPAVDFFVELIGSSGDQAGFFFAQVKTTRRGYTASGRLNVSVDPEALAGLVRYPAPTYVIGVDEPIEVAFVAAALTGGATQFRSLPTTHPLTDPRTLRTLYDEVRAFWAAHSADFTTSLLI
jgi:hypothetical protein